MVSIVINVTEYLNCCILVSSHRVVSRFAFIDIFFCPNGPLGVRGIFLVRCSIQTSDGFGVGGVISEHFPQK
jgi:hypothetical protein